MNIVKMFCRFYIVKNQDLLTCLNYSETETQNESLLSLFCSLQYLKDIAVAIQDRSCLKCLKSQAFMTFTGIFGIDKSAPTMPCQHSETETCNELWPSLFCELQYLKDVAVAIQDRSFLKCLKSQAFMTFTGMFGVDKVVFP